MAVAMKQKDLRSDSWNPRAFTPGRMSTSDFAFCLCILPEESRISSGKALKHKDSVGNSSQLLGPYPTYENLINGEGLQHLVSRGILLIHQVC